MKIIPRQILTIGLIATMLLGCCIVSTGRDRWNDGEAERRADYIFMEAQILNAVNSPDGYFELLQRAYELDTTQTSVGHDFGYLLMLVSENDSSTFNRGYNLMRRDFDNRPEDYYSAMFYGSVNDRLRRTGEALRVWSVLDSIYPDKINVTVKYAEALVSSRDTSNIAKAIDVFNRIEKAEGINEWISSRKVLAYISLRDTTAMLTELQSLLTAQPHSSQAHVYAGSLFDFLQQPDSALAYFNKACELDSTNGEAYYHRAAIYQQRGDTTSYNNEIYTAIEQEGLDLETKLTLLNVYIEDMFRSAYIIQSADTTDTSDDNPIPPVDPTTQAHVEYLLSKLVDQNPHEVKVRDFYAAYLITIQDFERAIEQTSYAVDLDPADEKRWHMLISECLQIKDYDKAIENGERAIRFHPNNPTFYLTTGAANSLSGDTIKALDILEQGIAHTDSTNSEALSSLHTSIGDILYTQGNSPEAFKRYELALELNPSNAMVMNNYAYFLACEDNNLDRAENLSAIAVLAEPDNVTYIDTYAWVFFKKKEYEKAKKYIDKALKLDKDSSSEILHHAGDIYFMNGEPDRALELWKQALESEPGNQLLKRKVKHKTFFFK